MKHTKYTLVSIIIFFTITSSVWAFTITDSGIITDVGQVDTLLYKTNLANNGIASETGWVKSVLPNIDITYTYKNDGIFDWHMIDSPSTSTIFAQELKFNPEYFLIKTGNIKTGYTDFLFENLTESSFAVIDLLDFGVSDIKDINIGKVSHITEFNGTSPVPEPSTMLLLGFGLLGIAGITRKQLK